MRLPGNGILLEKKLSEYGFEKGPRTALPMFYLRDHSGVKTEYVLDRPYRNMIRFHVDVKHSFGQVMPLVPELMKLSPPSNGLGAWDYTSRKELDEILGLFCRLLDEQIMPGLTKIEKAAYNRMPGTEENRYLFDHHRTLAEEFCEMERGFAGSSAERGVEIIVDHFLRHCRKDIDADQDCIFRVSAACMDLVIRFYSAAVEWHERFGICVCSYDKGTSHKELIPANIGFYMRYLLNEKEDSEEARECMYRVLAEDAAE